MRKILLILILFASLVVPCTAPAQVILKTDTITLACDDASNFALPLRVRNFTGVGSFQFTLKWNPAYLDYNYTGAMNPLFLAGGVIVGFDTTNYIAQGKLTFNWTKFGGGTVPDDTILFPVYFTRIGGPFASVGYDTSATAIVPVEVTNASANEIPWEISNGGVLPIDTLAPTISCPADLTVQAAVPVPVQGIAPTSVADNCGTPVVGWTSTGATAASAPADPDASGQVFNFGTSNVTYTVTDVGFSTASCNFSVTLENSGNGDLTLIAGNDTASCNQQAIIPISVADFDSIGSLQFSVSWNTAVLVFDSVGSFLPGLQLSAANFGLSQTGSGRLAFNWTTTTPFIGTSLPDNAVLFRIYLHNIGGNGASSNIAFSDLPAVREATDPFGNEVPANYFDGLFVSADNVAPVIGCPQNVNVDAPNGGTQAQVTGLQPSPLTDDCGSVSLNYLATGSTPGSAQGNANGTYNVGMTTVIYTATDGAGNFSTCSFTVTVNGADPLTISLDTILADCQGAQQICVPIRVKNFHDLLGMQFSVAWDETVLQFVSISDQYPGLNLTAADFLGYVTTPSGLLRFLGGNAINGWPDIPNDSVFFSICFNVLNNGGTSNLTFIPPFDAVNSSFNSVALVTENGYFSGSSDNSPPVLANCPQDTVVTPPASECNANVGLDFPTATDACGQVQSITSDHSGNVFPTGETIVTYTAVDQAGNSATCSVKVKVNDTTAPTLTCPDTITVNAANCFAKVIWQPVDVVDACSTLSSVTVDSNHVSGENFSIGPTVVVYTATDTSGNSASCSFLVIVRDTVSPEIICPQSVTMAIDSNCTIFLNVQPIFADNCDQFPDLTTDFPSDSIFLVGQTIVNYQVVDASGNSATCNFTVDVLDDVPPVISCPGDTVLASLPDTCGVFFDWAMPTAVDGCSPDVSIFEINGHQSGEFLPVGTTVLEYNAFDESGNPSACSFSVTVTDSIAPVLTNCPTDTIVITVSSGACDTLLNFPVTAADQCGLASLTSTPDIPNLFTIGKTSVTYTAVDNSGNTTSCAFTVWVKDVVPPQFLDCPVDTIVVQNASPCGEVVDWALPSGIDNCGPDSLVTLSGPSQQPLDTLMPGFYALNYHLTDASGNESLPCVIYIDVQSGAQGISQVPNDTTVYGCDVIVQWTPPVLFGFCDNAMLVPDTASGSTFSVGTHVVTYHIVQGTDTLLTPTASFTITVIDSVSPTFNCPEPIVVNTGGQIISDPSNFIEEVDTLAGCEGARAYFDLPLAADDCGSVSTAQLAGSISGEMLTPGLHTLLFRATDGSGNTVDCVVTIDVQGLAPINVVADPNPACEGAIVSITADSIPGATYTWTGPGLQNPSGPSITVVAGLGNSGLYTVHANINGCDTPADSVSIETVGDLVAVNDPAIDSSYQVEPNDSLFFNVLLNDTYAGDIDITLLSQATGVTQLADGSFVFYGSQSVTFIYRICSKTCPDLPCKEAQVTINVIPAECTLPNIITPNNDEFNDRLVIPCLESGRYPNSELVVYNQWGDKVFEAKPYTNNWDGTLDGEPGKDLPDGVYFYIFKPEANAKPIKGFVQIFR